MRLWPVASLRRPAGRAAYCAPMAELEMPPDLYRNHERDPAAALDDAVWLIHHMCEHVGVPDLSDVHLLDWGCGTGSPRLS